MLKGKVSGASKALKGAGTIVALLMLLILGVVLVTGRSESVPEVAVTGVSEEKKVLAEVFHNLSDEFMEAYFDGYAEMLKKGDEENILIVMAEERPNEYGAIDVVAAPNDTWYMMYGSEEERLAARANLLRDGVASVEENTVYTLDEEGGAEMTEAEEMNMLAEGLDGIENGFVLGKFDDEILAPEEDTTHNSWGIAAMGLDKAIAAVETSGNAPTVTVAVIDTGVTVGSFTNHYPDRTLKTYDVGSGSTTTMSDSDGHGTHTAGTVMDGTPNNVEVLAIRAGNLYQTEIIAGIYYAVQHNADVISMSLGSYTYSAAEKVALDTAEGAGVVSVTSAGNENTSNAHYASDYDSTMSIAALGRSNRGQYLLSKAYYSNHGGHITFAAPGSDIVSLSNVSETGTSTKSGTSMATPHVAAAVAVLKSFNRSISLSDAIELLKEQAVDLGTAGWDAQYGYGLVSFENAEFCVIGSVCDNSYGGYSVYKDTEAPAKYSSMSMLRPIITTKNYGSVYNILTSLVVLDVDEEDADNYILKFLYELEGAEITGYDAMAASDVLQTVHVRYGDLACDFQISNPSDWESGWEYENDEATGGVKITAYTNIERNYWHYSNGVVLFLPCSNENYSRYCGTNVHSTILYVPSEIDGKTVVGFKDGNASAQTSAVFDSGSSDDVRYFKKVVLPDSVIRIADATFAMADDLTDITMNGVKEIGAAAFYKTTALDTVALPNGLKSIGEYAFGESGLVSVGVPASVTEIANTAFYMDGSIEKIEVASGNEKYYSVDGHLVEKDSNVLVRGGYLTLSDSDSLIMPEGVEKVGDWAFSGLLALYYNSVELTNGNDIEVADTAFRTNLNASRRATTSGGTATGENVLTYMVVYNNSSARAMAVREEMYFKTADYTSTTVTPDTHAYEIGDTVNLDDVTVNVKFEGGGFANGMYDTTTVTRRLVPQSEYDVETNANDVVGWYVVEYPNGDSFVQGDTYYTLKGKYLYAGTREQEYSKQVEISEVAGEEEEDPIDQDISYATAAVAKTYGDANFTNPLTQTVVAEGVAIAYISSDASVATVNSAGLVTIVGRGTTTIAATVPATDGYNAATASYTLTVAELSLASENVQTNLNEVSMTFTGNENKPAVTVNATLSGIDTELTLGRDYTVSYESDTINVGAKTVTVTGQGNYTGTVTLDYTVNPHTLAAADITLDPEEVLYDNTPKTTNVTVMVGEETIDSDDYTVSYSDDVTGNPNYATDVTVTVTAKPNTNITGSAWKIFRINPRAVLTISGIEPQSVEYTAREVELVGTLTVSANECGATPERLAVKWYKSDGTELAGRPTEVGDYYVVYSYDNDSCFGERRVEISIVKITSTEPAEMSAGLKVEVGKTLAEIEGERTVGFAWNNESDEVLAGSGSYGATYTENGDTDHYTTLELEVPVYGRRRSWLRLEVTGADENITSDAITSDVDSALEGDTVTVTFAPITGYRIVRVMVGTEDRTADVVDNQLQLVADGGDINVTVTYEPVHYTLTISGENVTLDPSGVIEVEHGASQTVRITVEHGYRLASVLVNGVEKVSEVADGAIVLTNVLRDTTVVATAERIVYAVLEGAAEAYVANGDNGARFRIDADYALFENGGAVYVDGALVDPANYTTAAGSTVVTLTPDYISTLMPGQHVLTVAFADGGVSTTPFMIEEALAVPNTTVPDDVADANAATSNDAADMDTAAPNTGAMTGENGAVMVGAVILPVAAMVVTVVAGVVMWRKYS